MDIKDFSNEKEDNLIDNKYKIIKKEGSGLTSVVFKVKPLNDNSDIFFAAKVMKIWSKKKLELKKKSPDDFYNNEIIIFNRIRNQNIESPYLINLKFNGEGEVKRKNIKTSIHKYMILDYADRGCLYDYIYYPNEGLKEEFTKLIFYKILQGVKSFHDIKICNRDIKLDNILLDYKYNPKICDFGFAEINQKDLKGRVGTPNYFAPEIFKSKYDGLMVDIFNLGIVLLILLSASQNICTLITNENAKKLYKKKYEDFWSAIYKKKEEVSIKCKKLFFDMTSYDPTKRPNIDQVLSNDWFDSIRNEEEIVHLEDEIIKEFEKRKEIIKIGKQSKQLEMEYKGKDNNDLLEEDRAGEIESIPDTFDLFVKPNFIDIDSISNYYIKIKTDLCPAKMMNIIYYHIYKEFEDKCDFEKNKDELKFYMNFKEDIVDREEINKCYEEFENSIKKEEIFDDDDNNINNDDIITKNLIIKIKMLETLDGEYLLTFKKKYGDLSDYYQKIEKIFTLVKNKIK